jgi:hypothetical protein
VKFARSFLLVICSAPLCLPLAAGLSAQIPKSLGKNSHPPIIQEPFTALVTKTEARFVLPIPPRSEWKWRQPATKDNAQEYRLDVSVENDGRKYAFGFYLWKRSGAVPRVGTLPQLIEAGQTSVFGRTPAGMNSVIRDAGIKSKLDRDMLVITIRGQKNVERLFSSRPSEVKFEIKVPDETTISKTVPVVYQD